jgi:hypothetical protein
VPWVRAFCTPPQVSPEVPAIAPEACLGQAPVVRLKFLVSLTVILRILLSSTPHSWYKSACSVTNGLVMCK